MHTKSSSELPASYARREITEYIQTIIGKRRSSATERSRPVCVAFADPADAKNPVNMPHINDLNIVSVPTDAELLETPNLRSFGKADVIVLRPSDVKRETNQLTSDPNLGLLLKFVVTAETDPESMSIPIILDNRTGKFNSALEIISNAFVQGRLMGDLPFHIANTDEELEHHLRVAKDVKQRAPRIDTSMASAVIKKQPLPARVPHDGVFTVFIGGGHANNSKRDMEDATTFGYYCASQGWRIVTGAGSVEGSMGAIHTGFIQHHLDRLQESDSLGAFKATLDQQFKIEGSGKYDAEKLILINPNLVEQMAEQNLIPRNMFFGYSMKPLLEMESPSGQEPPGITYFDAGNRARRLQGLLAPGTKIFLPGSIGTDEEFEETVKQHLEAKKQKLDSGRSNDIAFSDGTPDDDGKMIIFNRNGHLDKLLAHYKLFGDDAVTKANRRIHNVEVVTSLEDLKKATESRGNSWLERARSSKDTGAPAQAA